MASPYTDPRTLQILARLLGAPADDALAQAVDEPEAYVAAHRAALEPRGIVAPIPMLPLVALRDALRAADRLVEIPFEARLDELLRALDSLADCPRDPARWSSLDRLTDEGREDLPPSAFRSLCAAALREHDLALCELATGAETEGILLVRTASVPLVVAAAIAAKVHIEPFAPREPGGYYFRPA